MFKAIIIPLMIYTTSIYTFFLYTLWHKPSVLSVTVTILVKMIMRKSGTWLWNLLESESSLFLPRGPRNLLSHRKLMTSLREKTTWTRGWWVWTVTLKDLPRSGRENSGIFKISLKSTSRKHQTYGLTKTNSTQISIQL